MDELVHHCLRELSFDGDLGSNVSRLRDFIVDFYSHNTSPQNPDDSFCAFIWSLVAQQPTVRIGTVPPGITSEVWVAPQISAKRKAKAKGEEHVETKPPELDIVPGARDRTLDHLQKEYGDNLRIAVDPDAIYAAVTGSHIRFAKMSPMVYSALQIITRGRENGVTVVELGQRSKYDQKTCFYLVRQLTELDLVVKVRRGGVGTHFVIHRHFYDRSPHWKAIREEEDQAETSHKAPVDPTTDVYEEEEKNTDIQSLDFTPIDARHLSSLPLIRGRVVKLLKASKNQMHASNNMLITLGFANPTKTDRRFFQSRVREMIQQGVIEKVVVPSNRRKASNTSVKCFRLVSSDQIGRDDEGVVVQSQDVDDDEKEGEQLESAVKMNITIHKQIFDLLEESGSTGMTLNELSGALCQFDKRTIELLLSRAEKFPPPSHLSDLGIAGLMETSGRERRHRYFTVAAYRQLLAKENLDNTSAGYTDVDFTNVGGFLPVESKLFFKDEASLHQYQDSFKDIAKLSGRKRPPKNPILPDGTVKQGRPRKYPVGEDPKSLRKKRKLEEAFNEDEEPHTSKKGRKKDDPMPANADEPPKKRGRPPKAKGNNEAKDEAPSTKRGGKKAKDTPLEKPNPASADRRSTLRKGKNATVDESVSVSNKRGRRKPGHKGSEFVPSEPSSADEADPGPAKRIRFASEAPADSVTSAGINRSDGLGDTSVNEQTLASSSLSLPIEENRERPEAPSPAPPLSSPQCALPPAEPSEPQSPRVHPQDKQRGSVETLQNPQLEKSAIAPPDVLMVDHTQQVQREISHFDSPLTPFESHGGDTPSTMTHLPSSAANSQALSSALGNVPTDDGKLEASTKGPRVNVSHLRRENELYRVIENMGGIVNIHTKDFFEEHMALLEVMTKAGEPTSAPPGTRTDKRTAVSTFNNLEKRGRIKQLKTSVMTHTGVQRPACIVYLPTVQQENLNSFLADLSRGVQSTPHPGNFVKIDERMEYGADPVTIPRGALPLQLLQMEQPGEDRKERWSKNMARADQLFSYEDSVIRDVLLTERTTLAQLYGFIVGKAVRCRELHLSALDAFEKGNPSSNIISHEKRIVDIGFFCHDIPLDLYCSLVSSLSHSEELARFISTPEGRQTLVRDLPNNINTTLQIGRSRARSRFLDILETLRALKLITPLQASTSDNPWITCAATNSRPSAFEIAPSDGWTVSTPMAAPSYWYFNDVAPVHLWAVSETSPPFWQNVSVNSLNSATNFWQLLQEASTRIGTVTVGDSTSPSDVPISVARSLRRQVSWNPEYILTWHQSQYLRQFTDTATGKTPLQDEDEGVSQIEKISWVISAPPASIKNFFHATHLKLVRDIEKLRKKAAQASSDKKAKKAAASKASLAKKAADARQLREEEWDHLVSRLYPAPLEPAAEVRIRRIRVRFLQAGSIKGLGKWEDEIAEAVREADMASKKVFKGTSRRTFPARNVPVPMDNGPLSIAVNPPEKPIETLIAMQGPPLAPRPEKVKRKRKAKNSGTTDEPTEPKPKTVRRHRFQWNRDYDELARDASAIIRARCRNLPRLDWAAFEQVFPAVPRNTVRQRLAHIRETPGNETYLNRLEDRWYEIWTQHRSTPLLPDDDLTSASNFNLIKHIEFLRQHVDKNALRVGFAQPKENTATVLPASLELLLSEHDLIESKPSAPSWDFVWNAVVEEGREKRMHRQPFLRFSEDPPSIGEIPPEAVSLAESALKVILEPLNLSGLLSEQQMTLGTPHECYDPEPANQNAIGGLIPRDTFQDAVALEDLSLQPDSDKWREWPLLATDGDLAALVQLVSKHNVDFKVDTSHAQSCRPGLDWNSKKADDDQIETAIHVRTHVSAISQSQQPLTPEASPLQAPSDLPVELNPAHGQSVDGEVASCRRMTNIGLVDCMVCLEEEWTSFNHSLSPQERELAMHILTVVRHAAEDGVSKSHLRLFSMVKRMTDSPVPLLFWAGYPALVLVSAAYVKNWTVLVSKKPATRVFPRRWLDISGRKIVDFWDAALKAVMGIVIFRPGITHAELRWRLRSVYDRQEVGDMTRELLEDGFLKVRTDPAFEWHTTLNVAELDEREEKGVFWFVGDDKHWFFGSRVVWNRITFSTVTIAYFAFSLVHFTLQLSFQIRAFTINAEAAALLHNIVIQGNADNASLPILSGDTLRMCSWVSSGLNLDGDSCPVIWNGTKGTNAILNVQPDTSSSSPTSVVTQASAAIASTDVPPLASSVDLSSISIVTTTTSAVTSTDSTITPSTVTVFVKPTATLLSTDNAAYEESDVDLERHNPTLHDTVREDFVFIAFQFWVLGMSIVALLNESIPHILASLVTHVMATAWATFQIKHTADFKANFTRVITAGACDGVSLLPDYWRDRGIAECTSLGLNVLALVISCFLTWRLFKSFGWQTFKRVGASLTINRVYKLVLTLSITIQLSVFFMAVTVSLWIDQLLSSAIGDLASFVALYKVSSFVTLVGWFAVRRELRTPMFVFLLLSIMYLGGWGVMFFSTTFRWTFVTWTFFSIMAVASVLLTVASLVLGVVCRHNFGKGLLRYLNTPHSLPDDEFQYHEGSDEEKVEFPTHEKPVPTFTSASLGRVSISNVVQGPRFFNTSAPPFETSKMSPVSPPPNAYMGPSVLNGQSYGVDGGLVARSDTHSSDKSSGSLASFYSYSDRSHSRSDSQKRWSMLACPFE
ncbi:hypothetical protein H0H93_013027 [Arthromyces matolae]|nr:hypothetical protein H0H93_013027 [Arthromyces matolae]